MVWAAWILALVVLVIPFRLFLQHQENPNRSIVARATEEGAREVILRRNRNGQYLANGQVNGYPVVFLLDTGATDIAVPEAFAREAGLHFGRKVLVQTANGSLWAWRTRLRSVALGGIVLHDVSATILPTMAHDQVLLGMSFLKHLELLQSGDTLSLRQKGAAAGS